MYQGWSVPHREEGCVHLREIGAIADLAGGSFPTGTGRDHDNDVHDLDGLRALSQWLTPAEGDFDS